MARTQFSQWIEFIELDDNGNVIDMLKHLRDWYSNHNDISISVEKSLAGINDTATVEIWNHREIEKIYEEKRLYFDRFHERNIELIILQWYEETHSTLEDRFVNSIFQGDLLDISVKEDNSNTDQALAFRATAGHRASVRAIVNKKYAAGMTYQAVVQDLFAHFAPYGYAPPLIDDPLGKLGKTLPKPRTYHQKASDALNDIARDLEMVWGFDSNPFLLSERRGNGAADGTTISNPKHCWWADKVSVFDITGVHGTTPLECNGSTGKLGRIGYQKSQFSFNHLFEPAFNVGMPVAVSDFGTMKNGVEFTGRVNRLSIANENCHMECAYLDDNGRAILEKDKKNTGALIL